tara:strand:- start:413 stop:1384 length:972 start_codon:yes stop_codon:yes gene_type:complete
VAFGKGRLVLVLACAAIASAIAMPTSAATVAVPKGNRHAEQPPIPGASKRRTQALKTSFDKKYEKIRDLIAGDQRLKSKIRKAAGQFGIDPIHIVGALVGEHTYNVDAYDQLQTYYVKAISYAGERFRFEYKGERVSDFVQRPQFQRCDAYSDSRALWSCREEVWDAVFRGKSVDGTRYPNDRFNSVFFEPFYAGQTFGLGQLSPLTALMNADRAEKVAGIKQISVDNAAGVYEAIMDPDSTLAYMAAAIRSDIDDYRSIAGFDISTNPGITATLYNVGEATARARKLARINGRKGGKQLPEENYYGWLVNAHEDELRAIIGR